MRRLTIPILIGAILFVSPSPVSAALSPWVDGVLQKIDAGRAAATPLSGGSCDDTEVRFDIDNDLDTLRSYTTSLIDVAQESQRLRERTICYESDRRELQKKMTLVMNELQAATLACDRNASGILRSVYQFAAESYASFLLGGSDPSYRDDRLTRSYSFENGGATPSSSSSSSSAPSVPICPFTTDYAPHMIGFVPDPDHPNDPPEPEDLKTYGCDQTVLGSLPTGFIQESTPLKDFIDATDTSARTIYTIVAEALQTLEQALSAAEDVGPDLPPGVVPTPPHDERTGCLRPLSPEQGLGVGQTKAEQELLAFPDYFSPRNKRTLGLVLGIVVTTYNPPDDLIAPEWLLARPAVDYFLSMTNSVSMLRVYSDFRQLSGFGRPLPVFFSSGVFDTFFTWMSSRSTSEVLQSISANLEQSAAVGDAFSRDAIERTETITEPLTSAVRAFTNVAQNFLPKQYIPALTYFLLRDCVDGHCQQTLTAVAKRSFNPYCHPYASKLYTKDDVVKRCFCDPSIQGTDPIFWSDYCSADFSANQSSYDALPAKAYPSCPSDETPSEEFPEWPEN